MVKAMKNKDKYNLSHLHIVEHAGTTRLNSNITYVEIEYNGKLIKEYAYANESGVKKFLEWLEQEYKPPILDDVEKAYLSAVIKPFRKDVECIVKYMFSEEKEFLAICLHNGEEIMLPNFIRGTMYKRMELRKAHTLKELEL